MKSRKPSRKASSASKSSSLYSTDERPSAWIMIARKIILSSKPPKVSQVDSGNDKKTRPLQITEEFSSNKKLSNSVKRSVSVRSSSTSRTSVSEKQSKFAAKPGTALPSSSAVSSSTTRKYNNAASRSSLSKKETVAVNKPVSRSKTGIVPTRPSDKSLVVRKISSSSKQHALPTRRSNNTNHHFHHHYHHVLIFPQPGAIRSQAVCQHCSCDIPDVCEVGEIKKSRSDSSTHYSNRNTVTN